MNVLQNLTELYNHLPLDSTYRDVVKGILMNLQEASNATIYDIAEMTNSSRTTVWRMVQKMGYEKFSDFRHALKQAISNYSYYNRMLPEKLMMDEDEIIANIKEQLVMTSQLFEENITMEEVRRMADTLSMVERVEFYFPYQSSAIAAFQQNLAMGGKETGVFCLIPDMMENAELLNEHSVVFVSVVEHAETIDMTDMFALLKKQGARIFMFGGEQSRYERFVEQSIFKKSKSNAIISELMLIDLYFIALSEVFRKYYVEN